MPPLLPAVRDAAATTPASTLILASVSASAVLLALDPAMRVTWPLARPGPLGPLCFLLHASWGHLAFNALLLMALAAARDAAAMAGRGPGAGRLAAYMAAALAAGYALDLAFDPLYRVPGAVLVGSSVLAPPLALAGAGELWLGGRRAAAAAWGVAAAAGSAVWGGVHVWSLLGGLAALPVLWLAGRAAI